MPFVKVDSKAELEELKKDPEANEYIKDFDREYESRKIGLHEIRKKGFEKKKFVNDEINYDGMSEEMIKEVKETFENFVKPLGYKTLSEYDK